MLNTYIGFGFLFGLILGVICSFISGNQNDIFFGFMFGGMLGFFLYNPNKSNEIVKGQKRKRWR